MGRVIVLGAGFSKAVADLPSTNQMIPKIEELLNEDLESTDSDACTRAGYVLEFIQKAREQFLLGPMRERRIDVLSSNFNDDFEFLLTILDLASGGERTAQAADTGGKSAGYTLGRMGLAPERYARMFIEDYIYRVLWQPQISRDALQKFLEKLMPGDVIITFNYDLVLDRALYEAERWHPADGYGVTQFETTPMWKVPPRQSQNTILKLHGSLNWEIRGEVLQLHSHHDINTEYLPGCTETPDPYDIPPPPRYGFGILPSLSKSLDSPPILDIWRKAQAVLSKADELVVIGYSLPKADAPVWALFATSKLATSNASVYCAGDAAEVAHRFAQVIGHRPDESDEGLRGFLDN